MTERKQLPDADTIQDLTALDASSSNVLANQVLSEHELRLLTGEFEVADPGLVSEILWNNPARA